MSSKKSLISGRKFNGRHTSYLDDAEGLIKSLKQQAAVKTISLGEIKSLRVISRDKRSVKCLEIQGGLQIMFRGFHGRQIIRVYLKEQERGEEVKELIKRVI